jgi:NAD(P)-dependent dehydrogenase (short-subunit alcohol dehydrogenase family)
VRCDVTREADLERAVTAATQQFGGIDVLVANAGSGLQGTLAELSVDDYRRQFEVNVFGVLATIKAGLPALEKARGAVGVVGSANGYLSLPGWSAYCMSKHAVRSLCASARHELAPRGISVTHLTLGFVESEFRKLDNAGGLRPGARDPVPDFLVMAPDKAARAILKALTKRVEEAVITRHARLVVGLERHAPRLVSAALGVSGPLIRAFGRQT